MSFNQQAGVATMMMMMMMMMLAAAASVDQVAVPAATVRRRGKSGKNDPPPPPHYKTKNPKQNSKTNNPPTPLPETSPTPAPAAHTVTSKTTPPTPMPETSPIPATVPLLLGNNPVACDPPAASKYDPNHHFCYNDKDNNEKYCWYYHNDSLPFGNWKVFTGAAAGDCSTLCTKFASLVYDPIKHYCYGDKDNVGKYCWYKDVMKPYGNWAGPLRSAPCDCGSVCASTTCDGQC